MLDDHGLLGASGQLRSTVQLVSMGDHFDWGPVQDRARATNDAIALLSWLAAHDPEQVVILAGNHDISRVCELDVFESDGAFEQAWTRAREVVKAKDPEAERVFLEQLPSFSDAELLARDLSCFSTEQRRLVTELLRTRRLRLAHAHRGLLLVHAGVTIDDFALVGPNTPGTAEEAAAALNRFLDRRLAAWHDGPLNLEPLHQASSSKTGPGRGVLLQRPATPVEGDAQFSGPPRRRYDPRRLPAEFPQAVGHIRDAKCRQLLTGWADDRNPYDGPLRSLRVDGEQVQYAQGTMPDARLYFLDGGMLQARRERYELLNLDTRQALVRGN